MVNMLEVLKIVAKFECFRNHILSRVNENIFIELKVSNSKDEEKSEISRISSEILSLLTSSNPKKRNIENIVGVEKHEISIVAKRLKTDDDPFVN